MKYFILLFTLLFHTLVYSQLNTSNRTVNQKLNFKAGANFNSLTASTILTLDGSKDLASSSVTTTDLAFIDNLLSLDTNGDGIVQFVDSTDTFSASKVINGTEGIVLPSGTTAERDGTPTAGEIRYNTDTNTFEGYSTAWGSIGAGGGGLDTFYEEDHEAGTDSSNYTTGLNATFDTAGTFGGTLADETASPIAGDTSIKYTTNVTATNSTNDWIASASITLDDKQKSNFIGFNFFYTWDGSDDLLCVVVWDDTNDTVLNDSTDCLETASTPTRYSLGVYIPSTTNALKIGFHHTGASESSKVLIFDDIELSSNPFVYKDLASENTFSGQIANNGTASITSQTTDFIDSVTQNSTGNVTITFKTGLFSEAPNVICAPLYDTTTAAYTCGISDSPAVSSTSVTVETVRVDNAALTDFPFNIIVQKSGADYQAPAEHVVTPAKATLTDWESYTPTNNGWGTLTNVNMFWRRVGDSVEIQGNFETGTPTAVEAQIGLPSGLTIDSTKNPVVTHVGQMMIELQSSAFQRTVLATGGDTFLNFSIYNGTNGGLNIQNANDVISLSGVKATIYAKVPIAEWSSDATFLAAVPMNYTQTRYLTSTVATSTDPVTDLSLGNLVIGKWYELKMHAIFAAGDSSGIDSLFAKHDGSILMQAEFDGYSGQATTYKGGNSVIFQATATTVTFDYNRAARSLAGGSGNASTFVQLTELNYMKSTDRFTP